APAPQPIAGWQESGLDDGVLVSAQDGLFHSGPGVVKTDVKVVAPDRDERAVRMPGDAPGTRRLLPLTQHLAGFHVADLYLVALVTRGGQLFPVRREGQAVGGGLQVYVLRLFFRMQVDDGDGSARASHGDLPIVRVEGQGAEAEVL